ncbi:hypothetical protein N7451_012626 [Penicillium sp. IBT 35674x]|nr:hypothetical protein N7451_012626 [Penicillium sp. IBT 35674x]
MFPTTSLEALKGRINHACSDPDNGIPGAAVAVIGKDGKLLFSHAGGQRGCGSPEPLSSDSVFWIASCTKLITGIACMQLGGQGRLSLDDATEIYHICPELKDVKVLQEDENGYHVKGAPESHGIIGHDELSGQCSDSKQPLVNQPGEAWEYGVSIDWVGILIERVSKMSLNDYFCQHIFKPLALTDISMIPTPAMKDKLACMHQRDKTGRVHLRDHLLQPSLTVETQSDIKSVFNGGGAGCFSTPQDYCRMFPSFGVRFIS